MDFRAVLILAVSLSAIQARAEETASRAPADPLQGFNRRVFGVNQVIDRHVLRPVAKGYAAVTPKPARTAFRHVMLNLTSADIFANDVLQLHPRRAGITLTRFALNTTVGFGGILDVGRGVGMTGHEADFGQTLGRWGVGAGPHLELPILGPSDLRDALSMPADSSLNPLGRISGSTGQVVRASAGGVGIVDGRARELTLTDRLSKKPDYYVALRDHYARRRSGLVEEARHGGPPAPAADQDDEPTPGPVPGITTGS
jgi:phospholipid-binding lipoprotein MlaA